MNRINTTAPSFDELERLFHYLSKWENVTNMIKYLTYFKCANVCLLDDGHWQPDDCVQNQRLAFLIPLSKQRWNHLLILLKHLHPQLINQQCHYHIFVIQQLGQLFLLCSFNLNKSYLKKKNMNRPTSVQSRPTAQRRRVGGSSPSSRR